MNTSLIWTDLATYSLQVGLLIGLAALLPSALRLRQPGARLVYLQILLGVCLLLPLIRPWKQEVVASRVDVSTRILALAPEQEASHHSIPLTSVGLFLLSAGALVRLVWIGAGFIRLRHYRRDSREFPAAFQPDTGIDLRISGDVASPVTFGLRRPVILLPERFPDLDAPLQEAILTHELLHVERRDWAFTVAEELVRAVFWFHPAIWWLLSEIQLAREQTVDQKVVERTDSPQEYVDALLAIAGALPQPDLAPASMFLRKRHLRQRVVSIFQEVHMSKMRLLSLLAVALAIMGATGWFVTGALPLAAVVYSPEAFAKGGQGTVMVQVKIDAAGEVSDASVVSGPDELRRPVPPSALAWHFDKEVASSTHTVTVDFAGPKDTKAAVSETVSTRNAPWPPGISNPGSAHVVKSITVTGLSDQAKVALLAKLPIHEGDSATGEQVLQAMQAIQQFDNHLTTIIVPNPDGSAGLRILRAPASSSVSVAPTSISPTRIRVGRNVQQAKLISQPQPNYPPEAKAARIQGLVQLEAIIAKDGAVANLKVLQGPPELVPAAMEAVRQWVYAPTLLNGNPVEVLTQIEVNFTLSR